MGFEMYKSLTVLKSKRKITVLRKSEIPFELKGNEPEQLIDTDSKDNRTLLMKI